MPNKQRQELKGQIERITFANPENGYTVARVQVPGRKDLVTVIGAIPDAVAGESLTMTGEWTRHPKFGEQFRIEYCQTEAPATVNGIARYLGSGLIKGIGPIMAGRIVQAFGLETLDVLDHAPSRLEEIDGIGEKRAARIQQAWVEHSEVRTVMLFLQSYGVSATYAAKIYKTYGNESIAVVKENPYRLASDIFGIGFKTADRIANQLGFAAADPRRLAAGVLFVLEQLADEGHVYAPMQLLLQRSQETLETEEPLLSQAIASLAEEGRLIVEESLTAEAEQGASVYLRRYYHYETGIARRMARLLGTPRTLRPLNTPKALEWIQQQLAITLAEKQQEAVAAAAEEKLMIVTGGPGTGKTTIINAIIKIIAVVQGRVLLAAPTGRAAKRMSEATGQEAKTIHRLLEYSVQSNGFKRNEDYPLACDLLIVDEASMIDTALMYQLLRAVPQGSMLILVGDVNQLPSVGAGSVLNELIASEVIPVVRLHQIFRQAEASAIVVNAHRINQGDMPYFRPKNGRSDFYFFTQETPEAALAEVLELVKDRIPKRFRFRQQDIQVLTPMHRGVVGAGNLNSQLQQTLNPTGPTIERGAWQYRQGDKVMQIRNNYDKEVFNGDIGRISWVDTEERQLTVTFDERRVTYAYEDLDELVLAYAVSIHKSQGSEYPAVVIPILTQHYILLQRNLLYTAVTRGKELVVLVGHPKAVAIAVRNNKIAKRYTFLRERLIREVRRFRP